VGAALVLGGGAAFWLLVLEPGREHRCWYDRVRADLYSLAKKRPADVPPGEWEFLVGWTINLHANCGASRSWVDRDRMWPFLEELERRLQGPVTAATIDWIWDEYARITESGRVYGERFRPTRSPDLKTASPNCFDLGVN
jgi:hypothetical protein